MEYFCTSNIDAGEKKIIRSTTILTELVNSNTVKNMMTLKSPRKTQYFSAQPSSQQSQNDQYPENRECTDNIMLMMLARASNSLYIPQEINRLTQ